MESSVNQVLEWALNRKPMKACRDLPPVTSQHRCPDKGHDSAEVRETAHAYLFPMNIPPSGKSHRGWSGTESASPVGGSLSGLTWG